MWNEKDSSPTSSLGQRIRELRMKKGITQVDLAKGICTPSMISQIESDRANPSYKILFAIADKLYVPLERLLSGVDLNLEYLSTYKMTRAMLTAKEYATAIPLLLELLENPRAQISTMDMLHDLGECYLFTKQLDDAERIFIRVQELAILRQDHQVLTLVIKNFGHIEYYRKHYQLAAYQWQKALEMLDKAAEVDIFLHACILFNLGLVHKSLGQIGEAIEYYSQAAQLYEGSDNLHEIGKVYLGLGQSYRKLNDLEKTTEYLQKAISIFESLENAMMQIKTQVSVASLYVEVGREHDAIPILEQAISSFHAYGNREEEGASLVELAKAQFRLGEVVKTESLCEHARILLPEFHVGQAWINWLLGKIALQEQQREKAIRCFEKAADCFKSHGEIGEWDKTMFEIAGLYLEVSDLLRAYSILDEMRRYSRQVFEERGIVL